MNVEENPISISASAAQRIAMILSKETSASALRVSVEGGGCSGFQYKYELVGQADGDDLILEKEGATVFIDPVSLEYMSGSVIDFVDDLIGQSFQINNPHAIAGCGCGTSFSV